VRTNREPVLTEETEHILHNHIRVKAIGLGALVFSINGWLDHVHVVASIPPKISVAKFVGQIKAVANTKFNKSGHPHAPIYWQNGCSVFSFDRKRLPSFVAYVEQQKGHHAKDSLIPILERIVGQGVKFVRDTDNVYQIEDDEWRNEFDRYWGG
jgi:REP element-mobilizing transposase RayT